MPAGDARTLEARFTALADLRRWDDAVRVGLISQVVIADSGDDAVMAEAVEDYVIRAELA